MRVNDDYAEWNAELQAADPLGILSHWRRILELRKKHWNTFVYGRFAMIDRDHSSVFCYRRIGQTAGATIVANFTEEVQQWLMPEEVAASMEKGQIISANYESPSGIQVGILCLRPYESFVVLEQT